MEIHLQRLYKTFSFILAFILVLPISILSAHDVTNSPWLYINNVPISEEMENPVPNTSKLDWGEHVFSDSIEKGGSILTRLDLDVVSTDLKVEKNNIGTKYQLKLPDGTTEEYLEDFSRTTSETGVYFLDVKLSRKDNGTEIVTETLMITVGSKVEPSKFNVNQSTIDFSKTVPTYIVSDSFTLKFSVLDPNTKYNYIWDLGTAETKEGADIEYSFDKAKIPVYVVLRTIDKNSEVFADSFVRIDSPRENGFDIPRPPVKIPNPTDFGLPDESLATKFLIGIGSVILLIVAIFLAYRRKIKR